MTHFVCLCGFSVPVTTVFAWKEWCFWLVLCVPMITYHKFTSGNLYTFKTFTHFCSNREKELVNGKNWITTVCSKCKHFLDSLFSGQAVVSLKIHLTAFFCSICLSIYLNFPLLDLVQVSTYSFVRNKPCFPFYFPFLYVLARGIPYLPQSTHIAVQTP